MSIMKKLRHIEISATAATPGTSAQPASDVPKEDVVDAEFSEVDEE